MKIFFDSNVYIAEALLGRAAARMIRATEQGRWRILASWHVLQEVVEVLVDDFDFSPRLAALAQLRIVKRSALIRPAKAVRVPRDPDDSPILQAALTGSADYLVTNDRHLLEFDPYQGLRIVSMHHYHEIPENHGLLRR